ncbi:MAG: hypothetical protein JWL97_3870, partial [Gemmatimonadales bacterium]|nr:hypothetical protein [Gemmatimonadales bacterium]
MTTTSPASGSESAWDGPTGGGAAPGGSKSGAFDRLHVEVQRWIWQQGWRELRDAQEAAVA